MAKPNNFRMSKVETERRVRSLHSLNGAQLSSKNQPGDIGPFII